MDTGEPVVTTLIESSKEKATVQMSYDISAAEIMWESLMRLKLSQTLCVIRKTPYAVQWWQPHSVEMLFRRRF